MLGSFFLPTTGQAVVPLVDRSWVLECHSSLAAPFPPAEPSLCKFVRRPFPSALTSWEEANVSALRASRGRLLLHCL